MKMDLKNKKKLQIMIFVMIAVITLGIGYAAISSINLVISGNASGSPSQSSFSVVFKTASVTTGTGTASINQNDATVAYFDVSGLSKVGDTAVATYTIKNESNGVGASITLNVTNTNTEYFQVTEAIVDTELQANEQTTATITVQMIKTPITDAVSTSITGTLTATPMENANATGSASSSVTPLPPQPLESYIYINAENSSRAAWFDEEIPSGQQQFSSFADAKQSFDNFPALIAVVTENDLIKKMYIAFERNDAIYYLRGGIDESSLNNKPIFEENVQTLKTAFGENWSDKCDYSNYGFYCYDDSGSFTENAAVDTDGEILFSDGSDNYLSRIENHDGRFTYEMYR